MRIPLARATGQLEWVDFRVDNGAAGVQAVLNNEITLPHSHLSGISTRASEG